MTQISIVGGRCPEEIRERPIFEGGQASAAGKYEAVFEPVVGPEPQQERGNLPMTESSRPTSMGKYEATYREPTPTAVEGSAKALQEKKITEARVLGKPIIEQERTKGMEENKREASKDAGIN
ncbi:hypothetical protein CPB84DRAFT_1391781 [Gymnopilus junonius]|uniref:Uncharacterized protein n=1 Tax=Gymnopilus junonius TaxID=109634 RepID=A0A9P5NKG5_GYMJU|nr:hypothetical protein CPB84DRAFT_1391781 [Gymnopilus junonius]